MVISVIIVLLTLINDVKSSGYASGVLAPCLKNVLALCFAILILAALIGAALKRVFKLQSSLINSILGTQTSLKVKLILLANFICYMFVDKRKMER